MSEMADFYTIKVQLLEARELVLRNGGMPNPYAEVLVGKQKRATELILETTSCMWSAFYRFEGLKLTPEQTKREMVLIRLKSANILSRDVTMGVYAFNIDAVYNTPVTDTWIAVPDMADPAAVCGKIRVSVSVIKSGETEIMSQAVKPVLEVVQEPILKMDGPADPTEMEGAPDAAQAVKANVAKLQQLTSPTVDRRAQLIRVRIFRGDGFPNIENSATGSDCNPYIVFKHASETAVTTKLRNTQSPTWNEELLIPCFRTGHTDSLRMEVWHRKTIGSDVLIATAYFSLKDIAITPRRMHWLNLYGPALDQGYISAVSSGPGISGSLVSFFQSVLPLTTETRRPTAGAYLGRVLIELEVVRDQPKRGTRMIMDSPFEPRPALSLVALRILEVHGIDSGSMGSVRCVATFGDRYAISGWGSPVGGVTPLNFWTENSLISKEIPFYKATAPSFVQQQVWDVVINVYCFHALKGVFHVGYVRISPENITRKYADAEARSQPVPPAWYEIMPAYEQTDGNTIDYLAPGYSSAQMLVQVALLQRHVPRGKGGMHAPLPGQNASAIIDSPFIRRYAEDNSASEDSDDDESAAVPAGGGDSKPLITEALIAHGGHKAQEVSMIHPPMPLPLQGEVAAAVKRMKQAKKFDTDADTATKDSHAEEPDGRAVRSGPRFHQRRLNGLMEPELIMERKLFCCIYQAEQLPLQPQHLILGTASLQVQIRMMYATPTVSCPAGPSCANPVWYAANLLEVRHEITPEQRLNTTAAAANNNAGATPDRANDWMESPAVRAALADDFIPPMFRVEVLVDGVPRYTVPPKDIKVTDTPVWFPLVSVEDESMPAGALLMWLTYQDVVIDQYLATQSPRAIEKSLLTDIESDTHKGTLQANWNCAKQFGVPRGVATALARHLHPWLPVLRPCNLSFVALGLRDLQLPNHLIGNPMLTQDVGEIIYRVEVRIPDVCAATLAAAGWHMQLQQGCSTSVATTPESFLDQSFSMDVDQKTHVRYRPFEEAVVTPKPKKKDSHANLEKAAAGDNNNNPANAINNMHERERKDVTDDNADRKEVAEEWWPTSNTDHIDKHMDEEEEVEFKRTKQYPVARRNVIIALEGPAKRLFISDRVSKRTWTQLRLTDPQLLHYCKCLEEVWLPVKEDFVPVANVLIWRHSSLDGVSDEGMLSNVVANPAALPAMQGNWTLCGMADIPLKPLVASLPPMLQPVTEENRDEQAGGVLLSARGSDRRMSAVYGGSSYESNRFNSEREEDNLEGEWGDAAAANTALQELYGALILAAEKRGVAWKAFEAEYQRVVAIQNDDDDDDDDNGGGRLRNPLAAAAAGVIVASHKDDNRSVVSKASKASVRTIASLASGAPIHLDNSVFAMALAPQAYEVFPTGEETSATSSGIIPARDLLLLDIAVQPPKRRAFGALNARVIDPDQVEIDIDQSSMNENTQTSSAQRKQAPEELAWPIEQLKEQVKRRQVGVGLGEERLIVDCEEGKGDGGALIVRPVKMFELYGCALEQAPWAASIVSAVKLYLPRSKALLEVLPGVLSGQLVLSWDKNKRLALRELQQLGDGSVALKAQDADVSWDPVGTLQLTVALTAADDLLQLEGDVDPMPTLPNHLLRDRLNDVTYFKQLVGKTAKADAMIMAKAGAGAVNMPLKALPPWLALHSYAAVPSNATPNSQLVRDAVLVQLLDNMNQQSSECPVYSHVKVRAVVFRGYGIIDEAGKPVYSSLSASVSGLGVQDEEATFALTEGDTFSMRRGDGDANPADATLLQNALSVNPVYDKEFILDAIIPGRSELRLQVWKQSDGPLYTLQSPSLLGECRIPLERRWSNPVWRRAALEGQQPIEFVDLVLPSKKPDGGVEYTNKGKLKIAVGMSFPGTLPKIPFDREQGSGNKLPPWELRIIVWTLQQNEKGMKVPVYGTAEVLRVGEEEIPPRQAPLGDEKPAQSLFNRLVGAEEDAAYLQAAVQDRVSTAYRTPTHPGRRGTGERKINLEINWRMRFRMNVEAPESGIYPRLRLRHWRPMPWYTSDRLLSEAVLDLAPLLRYAELKATETHNVGVQVVNLKPVGEFGTAGRAWVQVALVPQALYRSRPVGAGRSAPNQDPYIPEPNVPPQFTAWERFLKTLKNSGMFLVMLLVVIIIAVWTTR